MLKRSVKAVLMYFGTYNKIIKKTVHKNLHILQLFKINGKMNIIYGR